MGTVILRKRAAGFAWFALGGVFASAVWSPAAPAQEEREDRHRRERVWVFGADARPKLGVYLEDSRGDERGGVLVVALSDGGPAEEAGIREGDLIVSIDGRLLSEPLEDEGEFGEARHSPAQRLRALIRDVREGEEVEVGVDRDGESLTFTVVPAGLAVPGAYVWRGPDTPGLDTLSIRLRNMHTRWRERMEEIRDRYEEADWPHRVYSGRDPRIEIIPDVAVPEVLGDGQDWGFRFRYSLVPSVVHGLDLVELNPQLGAYFGTAEGVLVADADEESPLGLRPGDVVVEVEGRKVDDVAELRRILGSYTEDEEIEFTIRRDGAETSIVGTISRP